MTDVADAVVSGRRRQASRDGVGEFAGRPVPDSPAATRTAHPRWRDGRLVAGVVLVLLAVLTGARVLSGAGRTTAVLVAAQPLPAGHVISAGDVRISHIRLSGVSGRYWPGTAALALTGHPVIASVGSGDLLPRSAVGQSTGATPMRIVSVPVDPDRLPPLHAGDIVDVFATAKAVAGSVGSTTAVLRGVEFLGGGDAGNSASIPIRLRVPVAQTAALVRASETATLDIVAQQPAGTDAGDVGSGVLGPPP